uniref:Uncharacterized protein n=1 Tax=Timema shepardi TaxID=629360 RepID=A0A7R9B2X2_TIMSH|nr:unnamed protein product [Timema shepardi]
MKSVFCKTAMVLVAIMVMVLTVPTWARDERYTSKYDDMDVEHILNSDRLTDSYVHCLLEQGPCTPEGKVMKNTNRVNCCRVFGNSKSRFVPCRHTIEHASGWIDDLGTRLGSY